MYKEITMNNNLQLLWQKIYGDGHTGLFKEFIVELGAARISCATHQTPPEWFRDVVVYSLYVDLFNDDFDGLANRLDYLAELGVSCLWLLPILDSPMRDAGFDISDYRSIRPELLPGDDPGARFRAFVEKAHERDIRIIFDIAINHTSEEHPWFKEALKSPDNPYRDYYIWSDNDKLYSDARIIFKGIETSNWTKKGDAFFFHRFFDFQPDLNYRNPIVLIEMCRNMIYWMQQGVDGFRADAIPYLWKEEGTDCENLETTHDLVKFFRAVLDTVRPNTLLLAEACQKPHEVVRYFGEGDECHAGYHFPLMPQIFKSIAAGSARPITGVLDPTVTPPLPEGTQWFTFLRCHDELSLELVYVSEEDRAYIHNAYCKDPQWDFRQGQGISARLADLMEGNPDKIGLAFSIMFSLPGTPVIYYGDEFGKRNDEAFYAEQIKLTGKDDTRFLVRGRIDWEALQRAIDDDSSLESNVLGRVSTLLTARNKYICFGRGDLIWLQPDISPAEKQDAVLAFDRVYQEEHIRVVNNLSDQPVTITFDDNTEIELAPYGYRWITLE
jgi:maltose alpha-D-glucosyltransferase / alpha-amylase